MDDRGIESLKLMNVERGAGWGAVWNGSQWWNRERNEEQVLERRLKPRRGKAREPAIFRGILICLCPDESLSSVLPQRTAYFQSV